MNNTGMGEKISKLELLDENYLTNKRQKNIFVQATFAEEDHEKEKEKKVH